jgi:inward rectifier potassium channel
MRDAYHFLLRNPWWVTIAIIGAMFIVVNSGFALLYWMVGGIANARAGSFEDAFFFSVQTLGTIGYGAMYPQTRAANTVVALESLVGVIVLALSTGIAFAKFARADARIVFTREAVVCLINGEPHLMFRVANQRGHLVTSARVTLALIREERSAEGSQLYRLLDLAPVRNHHIAFTRSWTVMHRIDEQSPLYGSTPESLIAGEAEIIIGLEGLDAASGQTVTAQHSFLAREILYGMQFADIWIDLPGGRARLDFTHFHETQPAQPTPAFPYRGGVRVQV